MKISLYQDASNGLHVPSKYNLRTSLLPLGQLIHQAVPCFFPPDSNPKTHSVYLEMMTSTRGSIPLGQTLSLLSKLIRLFKGENYQSRLLERNVIKTKSFIVLFIRIHDTHGSGPLGSCNPQQQQRQTKINKK